MMTVLSPGALTTVQDSGRIGHLAEGYPTCGACDLYMLALCNLLAGNGDAPGMAALEFTLTGPSLRFDAPTLLALGGEGLHAVLGGKPVPAYTPLLAAAGDVLEIGMLTEGLRGIIAFYGGLDVPPVLGSRATDLKCHIGGLQGRALRAGDMLRVLRAFHLPQEQYRVLSMHALPPQPWALHPFTPRRTDGHISVPVLRVVPGPQQDAFSPAGLETLALGLYTVTPDSNRMAAKLSGPTIDAPHGVDILSDGIVAGSIQVSANGQPIVMLSDHQSTGGYAKIGTVIGCDLPALAQCRPGEAVAFRFVTVEEGAAAYQKEREKWLWLKELIQYD